MAIGNIGESFGFGGFDMSIVLSKLYYFAGIIFLAVIIGIGLGVIYYIYKRKNDPQETKKIGWWNDINGHMQPGKMDEAEEIVIPGTTLRVFYVKARDLWLPRFNRGVSENLYYVMITPTGQMVNFTLQSLTDSLKEASLEYDHTDMLWAAENTREFIKRNYKDKSIKWWQLYQGVLTNAAYIVLITFSMAIIIYFLRGVVGDIGAVADTLGNILKETEAARRTSGVVGA